MKVFFSIIILLSFSAIGQTNIHIESDTILLNDSVQFKFSTAMFNDGSPGFCGKFVSFKDSLKPGDTLQIDYQFEINPLINFSSPCTRRDSFKYKFSNPGNYTIIGYWSSQDTAKTFAVNSRYDTVITSLTVLNTTSLSVETVPNLTITPNPFMDVISIKNTILHNPSQIEVYDLNGRLVFQQFQPMEKINLSFINPGLYLARIKINGTFLEIKLIKSQ